MKSTTAGFPPAFAARARSRAGWISAGSTTFSPWHWQAWAMAAKSGLPQRIANFVISQIGATYSRLLLGLLIIDFLLTIVVPSGAAVLVIMFSEQAFLNAGPLVIRGLQGAAAAGFIFNVLMIARAPLQLFQAIQTSLLPHLTGLDATKSHAAFDRAVRVTVLAIAGFTAAVALGRSTRVWRSTRRPNLLHLQVDAAQDPRGITDLPSAEYRR